MTMSNTPFTTSSDERLNSPGIFSLPEQDTQLDTLQACAEELSPSRVGGSKATLDADDEEALLANDADTTASDFPMIVWLRGDEPWYADFNMDADGVMKSLGIKRSRLTQISGRDLRVGRVRVDRYVRPIYRFVDVQQYLKWTRATASHQKSSDSIKLATSHLQEQSQHIQSTLQTIGASFTESLREEMSSFISGAVANGLLPLEQRLDSFQTSVLELTTDLNSQVTRIMAATFEQLKQTSDTIQESSRMQSAALEVLTLQLNQTSEKAAAMEQRLAMWDSTMTNSLQSITSGILELNKPEPFRKMSQRKNMAIVCRTKPETQKPKLALRSAPARRKPKIGT